MPRASTNRFRKPSSPIHIKLDNLKPSQLKRKKVTKKRMVIFKCSKSSHKAFQCKTQKKVNELFVNDPNLQKKLYQFSLLILLRKKKIAV